MTSGQGKASHFLGQHSWIAVSANDSRMPSRREVTSEPKQPQAEALKSSPCDLLGPEPQEEGSPQYLSVVQVSQMLFIPRMQVRQLMMNCSLGEVTRNASGHLRVRESAVEAYRRRGLTLKPRRPPSIAEPELFWLYD